MSGQAAAAICVLLATGCVWHRRLGPAFAVPAQDSAKLDQALADMAAHPRSRAGTPNPGKEGGSDSNSVG